MSNRRPRPVRMSFLFSVLPLVGAYALTACSGPSAGTGTEEPSPSVTSTASPATPSVSPTVSATRSASAPDPAIVGWLGSFCAARTPLNDVLSGASIPQVPENTTEATRSEAIAFLTKARDGFARSNAILADVGKAPVSGGDEAVAAAERETDKLRRSMDTYLSNVKRFPASEIGAPYRLALVELVSTSPFDSLYALDDNDPAVAAAYKQAPGCA